jgi:glycosyltransferase involved in cell wall biosynthesis
VSVVINTLDRREHLERTLISLLAQTHKEFEVIVVNGPSVDGTDEMLSSFRDRARLATCDVASLGRSRNIGVAMASGEIVAFIDDDAIPRANWLEALVVPYQDPSVAAVGGPVFDVPLNRVAWALCTCTRLGFPDTSSAGPIERYLGAGADPLAYLPGCNMSFRRQVLQEVGGFNSLLIYNYDDVEVCSRVIDRGYRVHVVDDVLVRHERAANAVRDKLDGVRDPYPGLYCHAVFAMQCRQPAPRCQEIAAVIQRARDDTISLANSYLAEGRLTSAERDSFVARTRRAVDDGLKAGSGARPVVPFEPPARAQFRRYS